MIENKTVTIYKNRGPGEPGEVHEVWCTRNGQLVSTQKPGAKPVSVIRVDGKAYIVTKNHQLC